MSSSMVERVARAQYAQWRGNSMLSSAPDWDACDELDQASWLDNARAAIQAMREPTREMVAAGGEYIGSRDGARNAFAMMIDTALAPPTSAEQSGEKG